LRRNAEARNALMGAPRKISNTQAVLESFSRELMKLLPYKIV